MWRAPGLRQPLSRHQRAAACVLVSTLRSATVALISGVESGDNRNGFWIEISGRHGGWRGKIPDHPRRATNCKCSNPHAHSTAVFCTFCWLFLHQGAGLRNTSVTLMLYWDHMPLTGTLFQHSVAVDTFDCPGKQREGESEEYRDETY